MEYKIVTSNTSRDLTEKVNAHIEEGWEPVGSHQVVVQRKQNRYSGTQHMDSVYQAEYSQTIIKKD